MQLFNPSAEVRAILTITAANIPEDKRSTWLGKMTADMFHTPACKQAYLRIDKLAKTRFKIISFKGLIADPSLDEDIRDLLAKTREKPCRKRSQVNEMFDTLLHYRKIRYLYEAATFAIDSLEKPKIDIEEVLSKVSTTLGVAQSNHGGDEFFLHFGANDTSDGVMDRILKGEVAPRITTGYVEYDTRSGGFPDNGVVIIAATTSGGKSTVAMNICRHMYMQNNLSTMRVTLEMQELQETQRLLSHLTQIPLSKFTRGLLDRKDKIKVKNAWEKFRAHGKQSGINYTTWSPKASQSMEDVLRACKPFGYKVIVIDYVGLLTQKGDDQWKGLLDAVGTAKNYTRETGTLVIVLAQLDDEKEKLRYSKGMKEHADTVWQWNYTSPEQRELRRLQIHVSKDRDGELFMFELDERYDVMTAKNVDSENSGATYETDEDDSAHSSPALS